MGTRACVVESDTRLRLSAGAIPVKPTSYIGG